MSNASSSKPSTQGRAGLHQLLDDASYLEDELEALKFVIESVPYREKPLGEYSILELIALIDYAQEHIYRPLFELAAQNKQLRPKDEPEFTFKQDKVTSVNKFLDSIIGHRVSLMKTVDKIHSEEWKEPVVGRDITLFDLLDNMIDNEREQLRKVAERVMTMDDENGP